MEWLDKVPEHWHVANIKRSTYLKGRVGWKGLTSNEFEVESYAYLVTGTDFKNKYVEWSFCYQVNEERFNDDPYIQLKNNDLLITKDGTIGKLAVVKDLDKPACLNSGIFLIRPEKYYLSEYMYYILKSSVFKNFFEIHSTGSTILHLYQNVFEKFSFAYPSFNEQKKIVSFLDTETTRIDNLIAKQEKLIELLEEQRKSIISHAVTKGLNPNAPMKDSGVEWLGDVPSHWATPSSKHLLEIPITDGPHETPNFVDDGVPFISAEAISKGKIDFNKKRGYITPELNKIYSRKYFPRIEDIYMVKSGATTGKVAMVETTDEFNIWSPLAVFRCNKNKIFPNFLLSVFNSSHFYDALVLNWSYGTQQNIGMGVLSNIEIPCPPLKEQNEIIEYLDTENLKFDNLISKQQALIEKLKEYRSSIISHAVTGKIDVREFC